MRFRPFHRSGLAHRMLTGESRERDKAGVLRRSGGLRPVAWLVAVVLAGGVSGQEPLQTPAPLVAAGAGASVGNNAVTLFAAERAQAMGFPSAAVELYRRLLEQPGRDRARLELALVTALLDEGRLNEAEEALSNYGGVRNSAWQLRSGLIAAYRKNVPVARAASEKINPGELSATDKGWHYFLQGLLAEAAGDLSRAGGWFEQAATAEGSSLAKARFQLARDQARLREGPPSEAQLEDLRRNMERFQGRKAGYGFVRAYAVALNALRRQPEAVDLLRRHLPSLPAEERIEADEARFLLGMIAGASEGVGRNALEVLVSSGVERDRQRMALQLLARASRREPARTQLAAFLDRLIAASPPHSVLEEILLFRAEAALTGKNYAVVDDTVRTLLQKFPGSQLKAHALGLLIGSAWEQRRYRFAADQAVKLQAELPPGPTRAELGVLAAEAWYRARDFRSSADAYAAALREVPEGVPPGLLMFQRVQAEAESGSLDVAQQQLDELAQNPDFDQVNRWQAEWNLAKALQLAGLTDAAYARVNRLLSNAGAGADKLPVELRARMAWLQARLSLEAGQAGQTVQLADGLERFLLDLEPALRTEIASAIVLLKGEAFFSLGREREALEILQKLRTDFPRSDAAVYSHIIEADYYGKQDKTVEAQQLLTRLAEEFPASTFAPYALYQAALQAERRGQDANYEEANKLIEQLVTRYPGSELVFYARLKQGELLRRLNLFPQAQQVYETLVNNFSQHQDANLARLALAECHNAQSSRDPVHIDRAMAIFEQLRDRIDAPTDLRVEAGYNLGYLLARRGQAGRAQEVWWRDVISAFLLDTKRAETLGAKGRYWMTRSILELGALYEQQEKLEQARNAWLLILKFGLPGEALARARLSRFNLPEVKP